MLRDLHGHRAEGDRAGSGHDNHAAVGVGEGAGVGRHHVAAEGDAGGPDTVLEAVTALALGRPLR